MIDTKIKMMIVGLAAMVSSGCGDEAQQTRVINYGTVKPAKMIGELYVPLECATVTGFSATKGHYNTYGVIECTDTKGYRMSCTDDGYCLRLMEKR